ncbi:MAG: hypothetical protein ACRC5M_07370 [Anaeroplasmataceae bacterium]
MTTMTKTEQRRRLTQILNKLVKNPITIVAHLEEQVAELDRILKVTAKNTQRLADKKKGSNDTFIYKKRPLADTTWNILSKKEKGR